MTATASIARDLNGLYSNSIPNGRGIMASYLRPDVTQPELESWTLDMNRGEIVVSFSETVDITSFQPLLVSLQNLLGAPIPVTIPLLSFGRLEPSDASSHFVIQLRETDVNTIKGNRNIGTNTHDSYLNLTSRAITDMNGNELIPTHLMATSVVADTTSPSLLQFSLNSFTGQLTLTFDEIIDVTSFNASGLTFVNPESTSSARYTLTNSIVSYFNSSIIHLVITEADVLALNNLLNLVRSPTTAYVIAAADTVQDTSQNQLNPVTIASPLQALYFVDSPLAISFEYPRYYFSEGQTIALRVALNSTAATDVTFRIVTQSGQATGMYISNNSVSVLNFTHNIIHISSSRLYICQ